MGVCSTLYLVAASGDEAKRVDACVFVQGLVIQCYCSAARRTIANGPSLALFALSECVTPTQWGRQQYLLNGRAGSSSAIVRVMVQFDLSAAQCSILASRMPKKVVCAAPTARWKLLIGACRRAYP